MKRFFQFYFISYIWKFCLNNFLFITCMPGTDEEQKTALDSWIWRYRWLWVISALKLWAFSFTSIRLFFFMWRIWVLMSVYGEYIFLCLSLYFSPHSSNSRQQVIWHKLTSSERRNPQLREYLHKYVCINVLRGILWFSDWWEGYRPLWTLQVLV